MASSSSSFFLSPSRVRSQNPKPLKEHHLLLSFLPIPNPSRFPLSRRASRGYPNYSKEAVAVVPDPRAWVGDFGAADLGGELDEDDDEEEEEDDRSLDLFARLLQNMFRKISRRARRTVRSVLPPSISTKLVRFTVNGVLMLAFLWLLKAFLEVILHIFIVELFVALLENLLFSLIV
ncbi:uncharacterized protein LOC110019811 [Phalaenopsis equestris]|uniref:uncharacterized protein LOC110019811 n=1 Tax=Phalaenopsis equestris TaxID=78828 RepID=UPI0009E1B956|nr:uncharacterized protein LOC110019811 [Phalaenopsis equestris]